jgi:SPOR domain
MLSRFVLAVGLACAASLSAGHAQSVADIGGPAELPPASFTGQQYVDSRGCVFLRAGLGGRTNWAPRLDRSRNVLCGYPPTFGSRPVAVAAAEPEPAPAPVAVVPAPEPAPVVTAPRPARVAVAPTAPVASAPPPVVQTAVVPSTGSSPRRIGCFTNTPVPVRVQLTNGGSAVLCTRGDGTLEGARAPIYPAGSGVGASLTEPQFATAQGTGQPARMAAPLARSAVAVPVAPPPGYRAAWEDDRLNPNRAVGTAAGQAQQDQVWTREVPARLVTQTAPVAPGVTVSSKTEPATAPQATGTFYVQVGTFGVPDNAAGARDRLRAMGLATARANTTQGGQALTIVLAGPFGTPGEAQTALRAARGAGFGDAFIR